MSIIIPCLDNTYNQIVQEFVTQYNNQIFCDKKYKMNIVDDSEMIFMMSQFDKVKEGIVNAHKTIFQFSPFQSYQLPKLPAKQNIILKLLDPSIDFQIAQEKVKRTLVTTYKLSDEALDKSKIKREVFKVQKNYKESQQNKNIIINTVEIDGKIIRYVNIPIQKNLTNLDEVKGLVKQLTEKRRQFYEDQKKLKGQDRNKLEKEFRKEEGQIIRQTVDKYRLKQLKVYNIESILSFLIERTELISMLVIKNEHENPEQQITQETYFERISQQICQYVKIGQNGRNKIQVAKFNVEPQDITKQEFNHVSSLIVANEDSAGKFKLDVPRNNLLNDDYFTQAANVKMKIYELMHQGGNNQHLSKAIQQFSQTLDNLVYRSITPVATVVKLLYENLQVSTSFSQAFVSEKNVSSEESMSKSMSRETLQILTFRQVFQRFISSDLKLTENVKIQKYLTLQRVTRGNIQIQLKKGESLIPKSIQNMVFLHYFSIMNKEFLANYANFEKNGDQALLDYVCNYILKVNELVNDINNTHLNRFQDHQCKDMQKYFNFVKFLFKSLKHMKKITKRQFAICGLVKALFHNLQPNQSALLEYIIKNQENISQKEVIHYYDLYLQIIKENGKKVENDLQYIYLKLHKYKADRIVSQYIDSLSKVTEAVRSYCEMAIKFDFIPQNRKSSIKTDKFDIEKRIGRLLITLGRTQEALLIFKKNHMLNSVQKTFKFIMKQLSGNRRAEQCLQIAKYFEKESAYDKVLEYCRIAYEAAKDSSWRRKAKQYQMSAVDMYMQKRQQEKMPITKYGEDQYTEEQFNGWSNLSVEDQKGNQLLKNLRNNLTWDKSKSRSLILQNNNFDESLLA